MEQNLSSHSMSQQTGPLDAEHSLSSCPISQPDISSGMQDTCSSLPSSNQIILTGVQDKLSQRSSTSLEGEHNNLLTSGRNSFSGTNIQNFPSRLVPHQINSSNIHQHLPPVSSYQRQDNSLETQPDLPLCSTRINSVTEQDNSSHFIPSTSGLLGMEQNHSLSSAKQPNLSRVENSSQASAEQSAARQNDLTETEQNIPLSSLTTHSSSTGYEQMCRSATSECSTTQVPLSTSVQDVAREQNSAASASSQSAVLQSSIQENSSDVSNRSGQQQVLIEDNLTSSVSPDDVRIILSPEVAVLDPEENWPDVELLYEVVGPSRTVSRDSGYTTPSPVVAAGDMDHNQNEVDGDDFPCAVCGRRAEVICSGCLQKCYCTEMCQLSHWNLVHHMECTVQQDDT
ncbi:uncharacterized protein [Anabrus simplex]|uniref:uncharacterized protein n=1 Tax=Anabrus simplex TaxID=316456 RepID=UPI0035A38AF7